MASATLADIVSKVQSLVNDAPPNVYTLAVLTPYINTAQDELADELRNNGVGFTKFTSSTLTVTAGTTALTQSSSPAIPLNLVEPIAIYERQVGGAEADFVKMIGPDTIVGITPGTSLVYWDLQMDATNGPTISFNPGGGATTNREIRIIYYGDLTPLVSSGDKSLFYGAQNALAYKTASLVVNSRGAVDAAGAFDQAWTRAKQRYVEEMVKENQAVPGRRAPWLGIGRYLVARF